MRRDHEASAGSPEALPAPLVTVAVCARNEEESLGACLDSILAQDRGPMQVVVVDGASTDGTAELVRRRAEEDPRVELVHNPAVSIPGSLNLALAAARGAWFVRVDAHSTIPSDYVRRAVAHLSTGAWGGVGGRKEALGTTPAGRAVAAALSSRFGVGNSLYHYGTTARVVDHVPFGAYPTALLRALGGWDERLVANEDFELDYRLGRLGHELLFDPSLSISWQCRQSIGAFFDQYRRYGRGKADVVRLHPGSTKPRHLAAPALVLALAAAAVAGPRRPALLAGAVAPYALALGVASAVTVRRLPDLASRARVPLAFAAMHLGWGIGFWEGLLRARSTR